MDKRLILLIEDKGIVGSLIQDVLIGTGRYEVLHVSSGIKGLKKIIGDDDYSLPSDIVELEETVKKLALDRTESLGKASKFDLVLSDIRMPFIDGPTTVRLIKTLVPNQACAFITGYGIAGMEQEIEKAAPVMILQKPLTNSELVEAIDGIFGTIIKPS